MSEGRVSKRELDAIGRVIENIERVILGKREAIEIAFASLLAQGHILVEDIPGVGKTTLAKALARSISCDFARVQATSDLLPCDILGISIFNQKSQDFEFNRGPIFTNILLVDEINRTTPRTQSSLLQGMNEFSVTIDRVTYELYRPFFVIATQNPVEQVGTYLLPESQLDRFAARIRMGYPDEEQEEKILLSQEKVHPIDEIEPVLAPEQLCQLQERVKEVQIEERIRRYIIRLSRATRESEDLSCGASPRASLVLYRMAQARALMEGREFCIPDDVKSLAIAVLAHRLILPASIRATMEEQERILEKIVDGVESP